jgi:RES domain-containing protein
MRLWRLYRRAHGPGLDGAGGRYTDGRWHRQGTPVVYFGANAAIVVLEKLAHLNPEALPADLILARFEGELSVEDVQPSDLDNLENTRDLGERWHTQRSSCVLRVPSAIVPEESNLVLNPLHPEAMHMSLIRKRPFRFDGRLL